MSGDREAALDAEIRFMEALGSEARKYAVNRATRSGPSVWSLTLAQLPDIALTAFRAAHASADKPADPSP